MVSDVAMLVPSFSVSLQSPVLRPSPHHYSPFQVTSSCFFRSLGRPELSGVYKPPLEETTEPHFKGHGLPQASVLSREIGLTTLLSAPLPASLLSSRAPPLHAHAPSCLPSDRAPPDQVVESGLRKRAGTKEYSGAGYWIQNPKGGKQFWRGRDQRVRRVESLYPGAAEGCDWQPAGGGRECRALEQVDVEVA